jgi:hypothetical protein
MLSVVISELHYRCRRGTISMKCYVVLIAFITCLVRILSENMDSGAHWSQLDTRTVTFRCRPGDDCGGIGDRFAGIMGSAFYARLTGRSFSIYWPELKYVAEMCTSADHLTRMLALSEQQAMTLESYYVSNVHGNEILTVLEDRPDIAVVNDLNTRQITIPTIVEALDSYAHVIVHSNRGPVIDMYEQIKRQGKVAIAETYMDAYRQTFDVNLHLGNSLLNSSYQSVGRPAMAFSQLLGVATSEHTISVAFHHRVPDYIATLSSDEWIINDTKVEQLLALAESRRIPGKDTVLFFVTNCMHSARKIMNSPLVQRSFSAAYTQELQAPVHVNYVFDSGETGGDPARTESVLSLQQAMRDWWVLRSADVLVCANSGFCLTAALLADPAQLRYAWTAEGLVHVEDYSALCLDRFC